MNFRVTSLTFKIAQFFGMSREVVSSLQGKRVYRRHGWCWPQGRSAFVITGVISESVGTFKRSFRKARLRRYCSVVVNGRQLVERYRRFRVPALSTCS